MVAFTQRHVVTFIIAPLNTRLNMNYTETTPHLHPCCLQLFFSKGEMSETTTVSEWKYSLFPSWLFFK